MTEPRASTGPSLSRADWRFLLPAPPAGTFRHLVVLGGPEGLAARLRALGAASRVETAISSEGETDALILLSDCGVGPAAAARSLATDAVVYWELERRPSARRSRFVEGQLRAAGLEEIEVYWVTPDFRDARRYLPLNRAQPVEWFVATRFVASTPLRVALERLVSVSRGRSHRLLRGLGPRLAIVAGRTGGARGAPAVLTGGNLPASLGAAGTGLVLLTSGQDDGSRVVALPFHEGAPSPDVVVKMARLPGFTGRSEREQATLEHLRARLPPRLQESIPRPLGAFDRPGGRAFLESVVGGRMLATSVGRWRAPLRRQVADLTAAAHWLGEFHRATLAGSIRWEREAVEHWIDQPMLAYERDLGLGPRERSLFATVRERALGLVGRELPLVLVHNDFNPWHVYRSGDRVGVIDWEFVGDDVEERQGLPLCDLAYFLCHWFHLAKGLRGERAQLRGFRDLFVSRRRRDPIRDAARRELLAYARGMNIALGFLPVLIVCTWVERAVDRHRRRLALESTPIDPRGDNRFARYVEILAEGADDLFGWESA